MACQNAIEASAQIPCVVITWRYLDVSQTPARSSLLPSSLPSMRSLELGRIVRMADMLQDISKFLMSVCVHRDHEPRLDDEVLITSFSGHWQAAVTRELEGYWFAAPITLDSVATQKWMPNWFELFYQTHAGLGCLLILLLMAGSTKKVEGHYGRQLGSSMEHRSNHILERMTDRNIS